MRERVAWWLVLAAWRLHPPLVSELTDMVLKGVLKLGGVVKERDDVG